MKWIESASAKTMKIVFVLSATTFLIAIMIAATNPNNCSPVVGILGLASAFIMIWAALKAGEKEISS